MQSDSSIFYTTINILNYIMYKYYHLVYILLLIYCQRSETPILSCAKNPFVYICSISYLFISFGLMHCSLNDS